MQDKKRKAVWIILAVLAWFGLMAWMCFLNNYFYRDIVSRRIIFYFLLAVYFIGEASGNASKTESSSEKKDVIESSTNGKNTKERMIYFIYLAVISVLDREIVAVRKK